jgi:cytochrome c556
MKRSGIILLTLALFIAVGAAVGRTQEPQRGRNFVMQQKLGNAQKVLEGIAIQDFPLIEKHANELSALSNRVEWQVLKTPEYLQYSNEFRRNADQLARAASNKNIDGAALAYVQMTMSCVNCHKHVREAKGGKEGPPTELPLRK